MSKIILGNNEESSNNVNNEPMREQSVNTNLFHGRTEPEKGNAKFPDWDIVPPSQFINPRIKSK
jgi:hypothetical protein